MRERDVSGEEFALSSVPAFTSPPVADGLTAGSDEFALSCNIGLRSPAVASLLDVLESVSDCAVC